jgi:hypothetical protein
VGGSPVIAGRLDRATSEKPAGDRRGGKASGFEKMAHFAEINTRDGTIASVFRHNGLDLECPEGVFHHNHLTDVRNSRQLRFLYSLTIGEKVDRNLCGVAELESWLHG